MPYFDYSGHVSGLPSLYPAGSVNGTASVVTGTANFIGTAVDLADALGAVVVWTFGNSAGTGSYTPIIEAGSVSGVGTTDFGTAPSNDVSYSATSVGTATDQVTVTAGYFGDERYIRAAVRVHGTPSMPLSASVIKFPSVKS